MKKTNLVYSIPKFILRLSVGKANRPSKIYTELVAKYKAKLQAGGRATGAFVPAEIKTDKIKLLQQGNRQTSTYLLFLNKNWQDAQLDSYIAPHPLLGKITLRELCYFTIYHTEHHPCHHAAKG